MRTVAAGVVLLVAAVSGCSSGEAPPAEVAPLASGTGTRATAESPRASSPAPTVDTSAEIKPSSPHLPAVAADETPQGASAFTRYFFDQVNQAYLRRDSSMVRSLSHPDCNSCQSIVVDIERLVGEGLEVGGTRFKMDFVETAPIQGDRVIVDYRFDADAYVERTSDGAVLRSLPERLDVVGQARLLREPQGWLMYGLRLVEA